MITEKVSKLQSRGWICSTVLLIEEMLNPIEEDVVGEMGVEFPGGDKDIVERVLRDADKLDDEDESSVVEVTKPAKALEVCTQMEKLCLEYGTESSFPIFDLQTQLWNL